VQGLCSLVHIPCSFTRANIRQGWCGVTGGYRCKTLRVGWHTEMHAAYIPFLRLFVPNHTCKVCQSSTWVSKLIYHAHHALVRGTFFHSRRLLSCFWSVVELTAALCAHHVQRVNKGGPPVAVHPAQLPPISTSYSLFLALSFSLSLFLLCQA